MARAGKRASVSGVSNARARGGACANACGQESSWGLMNWTEGGGVQNLCYINAPLMGIALSSRQLFRCVDAPLTRPFDAYARCRSSLWHCVCMCTLGCCV